MSGKRPTPWSESESLDWIEHRVVLTCLTWAPLQCTLDTSMSMRKTPWGIIFPCQCERLPGALFSKMWMCIWRPGFPRMKSVRSALVNWKQQPRCRWFCSGRPLFCPNHVGVWLCETRRDTHVSDVAIAVFGENTPRCDGMALLIFDIGEWKVLTTKWCCVFENFHL